MAGKPAQPDAGQQCLKPPRARNPAAQYGFRGPGFPIWVEPGTTPSLKLARRNRQLVFGAPARRDKRLIEVAASTTSSTDCGRPLGPPAPRPRAVGANLRGSDVREPGPRSWAPRPSIERAQKKASRGRLPLPTCGTLGGTWWPSLLPRELGGGSGNRPPLTQWAAWPREPMSAPSSSYSLRRVAGENRTRKVEIFLWDRKITPAVG